MGIINLSDIGLDKSDKNEIILNGTEIYGELYEEILKHTRPLSPEKTALTYLRSLSVDDFKNFIFEECGFEFDSSLEKIILDNDGKINLYFLKTFLTQYNLTYIFEKFNLSPSLHDLFNLPFEEDSEIEAFILKRTGIDISGRSGLEKIQRIFNESIDFYQRRYLRRVPAKISKINFANKSDFISFIKKTKNDKNLGHIYCSILKVGYSVNDIIDDELINSEEELEKRFQEKFFRMNGDKSPGQKYFYISGTENRGGIEYLIGHINIGGKEIEFKFISRQKGKDAIIGKQISQPKYFALDSFMDIVGGTFYVKSREDSILLLHYIDQVIFQSEGKIDNKNAISEDDLTSLKIEREFLSKLNANLEKEDKGKATPDDYSEIKVKGNVCLVTEEGTEPRSIGTEVKVVVEGQDNEKGLSLHAIYDYSKRFMEMTRLGLPIRDLDILNFINEFFENIETILNKKNKKLDEYVVELYNDLVFYGFIQDDVVNNRIINTKNSKNNSSKFKLLGMGLYKYYLSNLIKFKIPGSNRIFYAHKRTLKMINAGLYPNVNEINESKPELTFIT